MIEHQQITDQQIRSLIRAKTIKFSGNKKLKIFGTLHCASGKRLLRVNRVFFVSLEQAIAAHYRPCGHCMQLLYRKWKSATQ